MLDRAKLLKELSTVSHDLFAQDSLGYDVALQAWQKFAATKGYDTYPDINPITEYAILAVDGSQIYPDRHQAVRCFLINIGSIFIRYGSAPVIELGTEPMVYTLQEEA